MDQLSSAVIAHTLRRDPPRFDVAGIPVPRVRVEVDCAGAGVVECGILFSTGPQTVEIYADEVAKLEALVEDATRDDMTRVDRDHGSHLAKSKESAKTGADVADRSALPSVAYSFRRIMDREMRPFRSVRRIEDRKTKTA